MTGTMRGRLWWIGTPRGHGWPGTHWVPGEEAEEHGNSEGAVALGQEGAQC
jgi:hypothetical protein